MSDLRKAVATVVEDLGHDGEGFSAKVRWLFNPVPVGEQLLWDHGPAKPVQPEQEPCGWGCFLDGVLMENLVSDEKSVDYWCASDNLKMYGLVKRALYTHPPQPKPYKEEP